MIGQTWPTLKGQGYITVLDYMGNDAQIAEDARVSTGSLNKGDDKNQQLIHYLMRHYHCYHPHMQVLTVDGWKNWEDLGESATFLIPNPNTRRLTPETLEVKTFNYSGEMFTFNNNRLSYSVTPNHRMWFKSKYENNFHIVREEERSSWGHFDTAVGYAVQTTSISDKFSEFVGFALGNGSLHNNSVGFYLKKKRKINYLKELLAALKYNFKEQPSTSCADAVVFTVYVPELFWAVVNKKETDADKKLNVLISTLSDSQRLGLWLGLVNSGGSINSDRSAQVQFCSASKYLIELFETLCAYMGRDAYSIQGALGMYTVISYGTSRTSLESRKQYRGRIQYTGNIYCATSSTGLLMVRGSPTTFGFVCGNTSPFEMPTIKIEVKCPIYIARQWNRHRSGMGFDRYSSPQEKSLRYVKSDTEYFIAGDTDEEHWAVANEFLKDLTDFYTHSLVEETEKEKARTILPVSTFTVFRWKIDAKNLMDFLMQRNHEKAQPEIVEYAQVLENILELWLPQTYVAFKRARLIRRIGELLYKDNMLQAFKHVDTFAPVIELIKKEYPNGV